ncbi:hypothetical protein [Nitriliruptor alkaliphilus]|uniref:hypothetical protein n=1 Tax=Nitriliruptor alkaliphilus TaxID=427918 RepID=UPI000697CAEF|nr:hypothetical protein [Nitriliruptor alkaliphilus]
MSEETAHDIHQTAFQRAIRDYSERRKLRGHLLAELALVAILALAATLGGGASGWRDILLVVLLVGTFLLSFEGITFGWMWARAPVVQRSEARGEVVALRPMGEVAAGLRLSVNDLRAELSRCNADRKRLAPFEREALERTDELAEASAEQVRQLERARLAERDVAILRTSVRQLEVTNAHLEGVIDSQVGSHSEVPTRPQEGPFERHALERYMHEVRAGVPKSALRLGHRVSVFHAGERSRFKLLMDPNRGDGKTIVVQGLLPLQVTDVTSKSRELARGLRSQQVHGILVLIDESEERVASRLRAGLSGLPPRIEVVAWRWDTAPHADSLDAAITHLVGLPPPGSEAASVVDLWLG